MLIHQGIYFSFHLVGCCHIISAVNKQMVLSQCNGKEGNSITAPVISNYFKLFIPPKYTE